MTNPYEQIRNSAGLIDLKDWARFEVTGPDARDALDSVIGGNLIDLYTGKAMNTLVPSQSGGVEAILWVVALDDGYLVLAEPEDLDPIAAVLADLAQTYDVQVFDRAGTLFHMVLTGPEAEALVDTVWGADAAVVPFLGFIRLENDLMALRIGYFGEYELHLIGRYDDQEAQITALDAAFGGAISVDDSALPMMMAEMRILNRKRDIPADFSVFQVGLQWMIDFQKDNLRAREALNARREDGARQAILMTVDAQPVAAQTALQAEGEEIGVIQSSYFSPTLKKTIALAFLNTDIAVPNLILQTSAGLVQTLSAPAFLSKSVLNAMGRAA